MNSCAPTGGSRGSTPSKSSIATRSTTSKWWWPTSRPHRSRTPPRGRRLVAPRPSPLAPPPPSSIRHCVSARARVFCSRPTARSSRGFRPRARTSRPASHFPSSTRRISRSTRRADGVRRAVATAGFFRGCWSRSTRTKTIRRRACGSSASIPRTTSRTPASRVPSATGRDSIAWAVRCASRSSGNGRRSPCPNCCTARRRNCSLVSARSTSIAAAG